MCKYCTFFSYGDYTCSWYENPVTLCKLPPSYTNTRRFPQRTAAFRSSCSSKSITTFSSKNHWLQLFSHDSCCCCCCAFVILIFSRWKDSAVVMRWGERRKNQTSSAEICWCLQRDYSTEFGDNQFLIQRLHKITCCTCQHSHKHVWEFPEVCLVDHKKKKKQSINTILDTIKCTAVCYWKNTKASNLYVQILFAVIGFPWAQRV